MQTLILGENGFLGQYFKNQIKSTDFTLSDTTYISTSRIQSPKDFKKLCLDLPHAEVIINCIALTDIDYCESNSDKAVWVNSTLPGLISEFSYSKSMKIVHFSTDAVFDGSIAFPTEEMKTNPLSIYGLTKLAGEANVKNNNPDSLIIRTNFFGCSPKRNSFAEKALIAAASHHSFSGYSDIYFSPTHARNVVNGTLSLLRHNCNGVFHLAGKERISKYEFTKRLFESAKLDMSLLVRGNSSNNLNFSYRSSDLSLGCSRVESYYSFENTLDQDIEHLVDEFFLRGTE